MHSLEGRVQGRQILLPVAVLDSRNPTDLTYVECRALLDTGATSCGISPRVIEKLGLRSHEKKRLSVATELRMVDYFLFRVGFLPQFDQEDVNQHPYIFAETDGFSLTAPMGFDLILGMDVLSQCDFELHRNGTWKMSFG